MKGKSTVITEVDFDRLRGVIDSPQGRVTHRLLATDLEHELDRGTVVPPARVPKRVVTMNSKVRIRDLRSNERETYTLVYPSDADIDEGRLSVLAPLGTALLVRQTGEVVNVQAPAGVRRIKVERILYQPEAAGDFHL